MTSAPASSSTLPWKHLRWALLVGLVLRVAFILKLSQLNYVYPDEASYLDIGAQILRGNGYSMTVSAFEDLIKAGEPTTYWGCLTPLLSAALQFVLGKSLLPIRLVLGTGSLLATFYLTLRYAQDALTRSELLVLGWIIAIYPNFHFLGSFLMTETLFIPWTLATLLLMKQARASGSLLHGILTGALFGLAHLTRPVLIPFEIAILGWSWWRSGWSRRWALQAVLCLTTTALVMAPWILRNRHHYGSYVVETKSGFGMHLQNNPNMLVWLRTGAAKSTNPAVIMPDMSGPNEYVRSQRCGNEFWRFIRSRPDLYAQLCLIRVRALFETNPRWMTLPQAASPLVSAGMISFYLLALTGLVVALRRKILPEAILLLGYISALSIATIAAPRYRAPADPTLLMLTAVGIMQGVGRIQSARGLVPGASSRESTEPGPRSL